MDISCDEVRGFINQHMMTVLAPIGMGTWQLDQIQVWVDGFFTKSTEEVTQDIVTSQLWSMVGVNPILTQQITQQLWKSWVDINELLKKTTQSWQSPEQLTAQLNTLLQSNGKSLQIKTPDPSTLASNNPIAKKLQDRVKNKWLLSTTVSDKQELDNKICNVVFDQIKTRSTLPWFTLSILLSLIFFFYPLIRLFLFFYAGILSVVYMILKQTWFISIIPEEKIVSTWVVWDGYQWNTLLSTLAFESKTDIKKVKKWSPADIAQHATPPKQPAKSTWSNNINDLLGWLEEQWWWSWWSDEHHIITPNWPQDNDPQDIPTAAKTSNSPHIELGAFGWNFDKKPRRKNDID